MRLEPPAYLGTGSGLGAWAFLLGGHDDGNQGIDSTLAVRHQRPDSAQPDIVPVAEHGYGVVLIVASVAIAYWSAPSPEKAKTAEDYGIVYEPPERTLEPRTKPGEWLEYSPLLTILISAMLIWYLARFSAPRRKALWRRWT